MSNLTKSLKKAVKQTIDPIFEELFEQHQSAMFNRQMIAFRDRSFEQSKTVNNEKKLLQMQ